MRGEAYRLVRLLIPASVLALRQLDGIVPENRFWLALRVCSWCRVDHSAGSDPVSVLLLKLMFFRFVLPDQVAGSDPAQGTKHASEDWQAHDLSKVISSSSIRIVMSMSAILG